MKFNAQNFGQVLKHLRENHGLSMLSLGKEIGTSASRIKSWENGESVPSAKWIVALSSFLNVPVDVLLKTDQEDEAEYYDSAAEQYETERWEDIMNGTSLQEESDVGDLFYAKQEVNDYIQRIKMLLPYLSEQDLLEIYTLTDLKARK